MTPYYINRLSVIPLRCNPSHTSEMVTQILYGEILQLLHKQENWIFVSSTHDNYEGWVDEKQLKSVKTLPSSILYVSNPIVKTHDGRFLPLGSRVEINEISADETTMPMPIDVPSLIQLSEKFLGTPYLWGGRTVFGIDCSGFIQLIFMLHGIQLPRDAYLQAEIGTIVEYKDREAGNLAFFSNKEGRVIHVGMLVDKNTIIHASGEVRKDTFVEEGIFKEENKELTHTLHSIKSIF